MSFAQKWIWPSARLLLSIAIAIVITQIASANQILVPLPFECIHSIVDEKNQLLSGTASAPGAYIEILEAPGGIFPPSVNGDPHPSNTVIATVHIGQGTDPQIGAIGKASGLLMLIRSSAKPIFARVFNRNSRLESSFYADSGLFTNFSKYAVFQIDVASTLSPLDIGDDDGDGLHNSWEKSLNSNPNAPDSDGDFMTDYEEFLAGTNPIDANSYLGIQELSLANSPDGLVIKWSAIPGKSYKVQYSTLDLDADGYSFSNISATIIADQSLEEATITNAPSGVFRIMLSH
jgi:hypothetical protein